MDLDLSALEAGRQTAGRSSQFNPRPKPRARPRRQNKGTELPEAEPQPSVALDEQRQVPGRQQESQIASAEGATVTAAPPAEAGDRSAPTHARPAAANAVGGAVQRASHHESDAAQPSSGRQPPTSPCDASMAVPMLRSGDDGHAPTSPLERRVRFAPAAGAATRAHARPRQQQAASEPSASPPSAAAAAKEQEWPDATPAAAAPRPSAVGRGPGHIRPTVRSAGSSARTVASQRVAAAAAAVAATRGAATPVLSLIPASPAKRKKPMPLIMLPPAQRQRAAGNRMPVVPMNLDVQRMSLKDVIQWSNSKERETLLAEKHRKELQRQQQQGAGDGPASPSAQPVSVPLPPASAMAPQVSIVDGQIVVDTATLTVQAQPEDRQRMVVVDTQQLNSQSYAVNRTPSDRWQPEETENFYRALATFGSDFTLIASLFPGKNRRQIKNKYSKETKVNAARIDEALKGRACSTTAYEDVLSRITVDADNTEMLEVDDPPPAD